MCIICTLVIHLHLWVSLVLTLTCSTKHKQSTADAQHGNYGESDILSHVEII